VIVASSVGAAVGALRALWWAGGFYVEHRWPLAAIAAVPLLVRAVLDMRPRQMLPAHAGEVATAVLVLWRGVLMLAIAGIDLLPDSPWWESIWPNEWGAQLGVRINEMSGRGVEWTFLCLTIGSLVLLVAAALRFVTTPRFLLRMMAWTGVRRHRAVRRAETIGFTVTNLVTIPLTTLLLYAALARAELLLSN
jgi:hypothetical protein